jgi:hypothetical protein
VESAIVGAGFNGDLFDHSVVSFHLWWGKGVEVGGVEDSQGVAVADARYFCVPGVESIWWVGQGCSGGQSVVACWIDEPSDN